MIRLALGVASLLIGSTAFAAQAQIGTSGDCSGIATNGGQVFTNCPRTIIFKDRKLAPGRLIIQQAILVPSIGFMAPLSDGTRDEQAELTTVVRNLGDEDIILNAAHLEIVGSTTLRLQGGISAADVLQNTIGDGSPVIVKAGQTARVTLGSLINLAGIISAVEQDDNLDAAVLHSDFAFPTVRDRSYVDRFSQLMSTLYGSHTALRVTYFARDYQTVATIDIPIKKSADFFYNGEIFDRKTGPHTFQPLPAYDAFLGGYLKQKEQWVPGFKAKEPERRCVDFSPDASVPGGWVSREVRCENKSPESVLTPQRVNDESSNESRFAVE